MIASTNDSLPDPLPLLSDLRLVDRVDDGCLVPFPSACRGVFERDGDGLEDGPELLVDGSGEAGFGADEADSGEVDQVVQGA